MRLGWASFMSRLLYQMCMQPLRPYQRNPIHAYTHGERFQREGVTVFPGKDTPKFTSSYPTTPALEFEWLEKL